MVGARPAYPIRVGRPNEKCQLRRIAALNAKADSNRRSARGKIQNDHGRADGRVAIFTGLADALLQLIGIVDAEDGARLVIDADEKHDALPCIDRVGKRHERLPEFMGLHGFRLALDEMILGGPSSRAGRLRTSPYTKVLSFLIQRSTFPLWDSGTVNAKAPSALVRVG